MNRRDGQFDREFRAIAAQSGNFDAAVQDMGFASLYVAGEAIFVFFLVALRNQKVRHLVPDNLCFFPAENNLCRRVEADQAIFRIDADHPVQRRVDRCPQASFVFRQLTVVAGDRFLPFGNGAVCSENGQEQGGVQRRKSAEDDQRDMDGSGADALEGRGDVTVNFQYPDAFSGVYQRHISCENMVVVEIAVVGLERIAEFQFVLRSVCQGLLRHFRSPAGSADVVCNCREYGYSRRVVQLQFKNAVLPNRIQCGIECTDARICAQGGNIEPCSGCKVSVDLPIHQMNEMNGGLLILMRGDLLMLVKLILTVQQYQEKGGNQHCQQAGKRETAQERKLIRCGSCTGRCFLRGALRGCGISGRRAAHHTIRLRRSLGTSVSH